MYLKILYYKLRIFKVKIFLKDVLFTTFLQSSYTIIRKIEHLNKLSRTRNSHCAIIPSGF